MQKAREGLDGARRNISLEAENKMLVEGMEDYVALRDGPDGRIPELEAKNTKLRAVAEMVLELADTWTPQPLLDAARGALKQDP